MAFFEIYKRNQGKHTRVITFASAVVIGVIGAVLLSEKLAGYALTQAPVIRFGIPVVLAVLLGLLLFLLVNRANTADFLIATEGEMKKVSWSSKKEIIGSTKVVIVTALIMAVVLFATDLLFIFLFKSLGIMGS